MALRQMFLFWEKNTSNAYCKREFRFALGLFCGRRVHLSDSHPSSFEIPYALLYAVTNKLVLVGRCQYSFWSKKIVVNNDGTV